MFFVFWRKITDFLKQIQSFLLGFQYFFVLYKKKQKTITNTHYNEKNSNFADCFVDMQRGKRESAGRCAGNLKFQEV